MKKKKKSFQYLTKLLSCTQFGQNKNFLSTHPYEQQTDGNAETGTQTQYMHTNSRHLAQQCTAGDAG